MNTNQSEIERRLWSAADELRANSRLRPSEYSTPVLGLIFLRYADHRFTQTESKINREPTAGRRRRADKTEFQARGAFYLPEAARFNHLLNLPESENIGQAINNAMRAIEEENRQVDGVLPKTYNRLDKTTLLELLRIMERIPMDIEGDAFGKVYEYFLGNFAMTEGARGGEFFTPTSLVKLIVEIIEPFQGRILDPACGSGGMFVQSADFVQRHRENGNGQISIHGIERVAETIRLCKMNLAVHGLEGDIKQANSYYDDAHRAFEKFDFVMANPPFNVDRVDRERIKTTRVSRSACPVWTTPTISGFNSFSARLTPSDAPALSWRTPQPTPAPQSWKSAGNLSNPAPLMSWSALGLTSSTPLRCPAPSGSSTSRKRTAIGGILCCSSMPATFIIKSAAHIASLHPSNWSF